MAVTKTPRKKTQPIEASKASKATPKKAVAVKAVKPSPAKSVTEKPAPKKPVAKKASAKQVEPEAKPARKARATATPEPATAPAPAKPEPKVAAKPAAKATPQEAGLQHPFVETILAAIREGRALEFIFADAETNAPRTFEPRQLTFDALSQAWYVWGWDRRYNAERFHRLDLLGEVNAVEGVGRAAQGPYAEGTPANQIGGWLGGEPIAVKATLMKQWVFAVKQAPPAFPHFRMEEQGDGQALVTFTATDLRAIARWIMQFGDGVQVLEPARLQDRVKQVAAVWMGRDRQPAAAQAPRHESSRHEPRHESKPEVKPAPRPEPPQESRRHESRPPREHRPEREARPREQEDETSKGKPGKLEVIRFDRL